MCNSENVIENKRKGRNHKVQTSTSISHHAMNKIMISENGTRQAPRNLLTRASATLASYWHTYTNTHYGCHGFRNDSIFIFQTITTTHLQSVQSSRSTSRTSHFASRSQDQILVLVLTRCNVLLFWVSSFPLTITVNANRKSWLVCGNLWLCG
jgi:hypothetical protein